MAMGAVIGALRANLSLNSAQFEKGLKSARRSLRRMQDDMRRIGQAVAITGAALVTMGGQAVTAARDIDRLSKAANATPRQLQRWSAATRTVGIDQEKLSDILKDVNDRVGDFIATGGGPMADFFENIAPKVGVTAKQFEKLSGPEALQLYVSSLEKAGVSQQQMTFYMEAMASDATLLLPLLRNNGKEMQRLGDAAERAGAVMSNSAIANLTKMGESADRIRDSFVAMRGEVAGALAPSFQKLAEVLQDAMSKGGILREIFVGLAENAGRITAYVGTAAGAFAAYATAVTIATAVTKGFRTALIRTGIGALVVGLGEAVYQFTRLSGAVGGAGKAFDILINMAKAAVNEVVKAYVWLGNRIVGVFRGAFNAVKETWRELPVVLGAFVVELVNTQIRSINFLVNAGIKGINKLINTVKDYWFLMGPSGALLKNAGEIGEIKIPEIPNGFADGAKKAGRKAAEAFKEGFSTDTVNAPKIFDVPDIREQWKKVQNILKNADGADGAQDALEDLRGTLDSVFDTPDTGGGQGTNKPADAVDQLSDAARRAQSAVGTLRDGLAGAFSSVIRGADSARKAVSSLLDRLADMIANNAFKMLFNSVVGNGTSGGSPNLFGQVASFLLGGDAFANGGVSRGGLAMVGERGPELVSMARGSRVHSAAETQRMLGDSGPNGQLAIRLADGLEAEWLGKAQDRAVSVTRAGLEEYDRNGAARRVAAYQNDPRARGR
jgi:hypothetical protein